MAMSKYPIEVFWSNEDEDHIATVPDLPGCTAWGGNRDGCTPRGSWRHRRLDRGCHCCGTTCPGTDAAFMPIWRAVPNGRGLAWTSTCSLPAHRTPGSPLPRRL